MTRRAFVSTAAAGALTSFAGDEKPRLRFGVLTDTHITAAPESVARAKAALDVFRRYSCTLFCHLGDLAESCDPAAHRLWRQTVDQVFANAAPDELYAYAAHDFYNYQSKRWSLTQEECIAGYENFRLNAKIPHGLFAQRTFAGVPFIAVPQHVTREELSGMIERAEARVPDGPIFVLNHVAPENTTFNSADWGCWWTGKLLSKHPRVINLCGHTHGSLANERNIWQGGFTSIDAGCLAKWVAPLPGKQSRAKESYGVLVCDVFASSVVFRRIDVRDGQEFAEPWTIPLPFDPATAPYALERRRAAAPIPAFPRHAKLELDVTPETLAVRFPSALPAGDVFCYRVEAFKRGVLLEWESMAREDIYGEFYLRAGERTSKHESIFQRTALNKGRPCRISVTPVGFFGQTGEPLAATTILR